MKKNVYLVQPNDILSNSIFLPYTVAAIASYSWQFEHIKNGYELKEFIFKKNDINDTVEQMETPYLVGFSCYMWNVEYNLALAKKIKEDWPDCLIVFGGPQIPDDSSFLKKNDFIDILIFGEGEYVFYSLLNLLLKESKEFSSVSNICFRNADEIIQTKKEYINRLVEYPSPYASGLLNSIVKDFNNSKYEFQAVLETNRGCPYNCIYCTWAGTKNFFRCFSMERIKKDLEWIAKNKINYCICADSNFGILERDETIADYIIELKEKYGYPQKFETTAAKNKDEIVFKINSKLEKASLNCGISVAIQSFSPTVLKNIGRENISNENFAKQLELYRNAKINTYTDFILALPGETLESFCDGLFMAIEMGQHTSINVHPCELLPNTGLYKRETIEKYDIKMVKSTITQKHCKLKKEDFYGTKSEIIVSTNTLSKEDWKKAMRISICVQGFHSYGLLRFFSVFLRKCYGIPYKDFYLGLYKWIESESVDTKNILNHVCETIDLFVDGKSNLYYYDERFSDSCLYFKEGLFLCCTFQKELFYNDVKSFLTSFFNDKELFDDLFAFQKNIIKIPGAKQIQHKYKYDWCTFFENYTDNLMTKPIKADNIIVYESCNELNWYEYTIKNIWYGKRENKMLNKYKKIG